MEILVFGVDPNGTRVGSVLEEFHEAIAAKGSKLRVRFSSGWSGVATLPRPVGVFDLVILPCEPSVTRGFVSSYLLLGPRVYGFCDRVRKGAGKVPIILVGQEEEVNPDFLDQFGDRCWEFPELSAALADPGFQQCYKGLCSPA